MCKREQPIYDMVSNKEYFSLTILSYVALTLMGAYIESLLSIVGIMGSFTAIFLSFIFPPLFYLKLDEQNANTSKKLRAFALLILGVIFTLLSTYKILVDDLS